MPEPKAAAKEEPKAAKPKARSIADDIDAIAQRIEKESQSPKARYALRYLRYAKGNL